MTNRKPSKRELTRQKVILAAIDCIYSEGFHAAHTNKIAETAGVSWGVLQYHFGDKDGLLQAVIDHIFDEFSTALSNTEYEDKDLHKRVRELIDTVWSLVNKKEYRVSVAILRNAGRSPDSSIDGQKQLSSWAKKTSQLWDRLFEEGSTKPANSDTARHLLFATLRGLVDEINPKGNVTRKSLDEECTALADAIHYLLTK
ncbi:MAG: TetR/AcrR family transcriptional regulator [Pseudomonadales bacterium]|nr:TetR/AcrR family transcriptional regulator [Pseudomonadales bacterium]